MDKLNQFADISVGDNYTNRNKTTAGSSSVIIRSNFALEIWNQFSEGMTVYKSSMEEIRSSQLINSRVYNYAFAKVSGKIGLDKEIQIDLQSIKGYENLLKNKLKRLQLGKRSDISSIKLKLRTLWIKNKLIQMNPLFLSKNVVKIIKSYYKVR